MWRLNFAQRLMFSGLMYFNEPEISDSGGQCVDQIYDEGLHLRQTIKVRPIGADRWDVQEIAEASPLGNSFRGEIDV